MVRMIMVAVSVFALSACATFKPKHDRYIDPALEMQAIALSDPRFSEILLELQSNGSVVWDQRLTDSAKLEASQFENEMVWMLAKYAEAGGLPRSNLRAWRKWNPFSSTTAAFSPKTGMVSLNLWKFNKNEFALLNTFMHEQNHSFGHIHDKSQKRINNMCDAGYLAGDLAEAILRTASANNEKTPHVPVCPALCSALEARGMWSACKASSPPS